MVLVELAVQTPSFPNVRRTIQSFIGEYFDKIGHNDLTIMFGLEPFEVTTQSLERTLVDKTYAICDYYLNGKVDKHSRHIYDIAKILSKLELNDNLYDLFLEVNKYRKDLSICLSSKKGVVLSDILTKVIDDNYYLEDYKKLTSILLYDTLNYQTAILSLETIKNFLVNHNL